jgi:hypothetical protein
MVLDFQHDVIFSPMVVLFRKYKKAADEVIVLGALKTSIF